jgi:cytidylate kinase
MSPIIIAVDGTAAAGKGTLARNLARIYHLSHLDTGRLYRAVGFKMLKEGKDLADREAAVSIANSLTHEDFDNPALRNEDIGVAASHVAAFEEVRKILLVFQRSFADQPPAGMQGVIIDGRDIGSIILPAAPCKIFVTASLEVRAERRLKELHQKGINCIYEAILEDIKARDARDETRKASPLRPAEGAYILDTSTLGIEECVKKACAYVESKYPEARKHIE